MNKWSRRWEEREGKKIKLWNWLRAIHRRSHPDGRREKGVKNGYACTHPHTVCTHTKKSRRYDLFLKLFVWMAGLPKVVQLQVLMYAWMNLAAIKYSVIIYMSLSACMCALRSVCKLSYKHNTVMCWEDFLISRYEHLNALTFQPFWHFADCCNSVLLLLMFPSRYF